ncbi:MAG: thioredoxin family protein [Bacteroidales bacterium]|nr:thioredoxin family protein [Bacteroidales bacterium]
MKHLLILIMFLPLLSFGQNVLNNQFIDGETTIVGKIDSSFIPSVTFSIKDPISGLQRRFVANVNEDSTFSIKLPLVVSNQMIRVRHSKCFNFNMLASINDTSYITINVKKAIELKAINYENSWGYVTFLGANADINSAICPLECDDLHKKIREYSSQDTREITRPFYLNRLKSLKDTLQFFDKLINELPYTTNAKQFYKLEIKSQLALYYTDLLITINERYSIYSLNFNYFHPKNEPYLYKTEFSNEIFSFIDELGANQMDILSTNSYFSFINNLKILNNTYSKPKNNQQIKYELYSELKKYVEHKDLKQLNQITHNILINKKVKSELLSYFNQKYETEINKIKADTLKFDLNKGDAIIPDLLKTRKISSPLLTNEPIENSDLELLKQNKNPFYYNYISNLSEEYLKTAHGATLKNVSDVEGDDLLNEILSNYKGKIVFIDMWHESCGACIQFSHKIKPYLPDLIDDGIAFVYLTSTKTSYNNYEQKSSSLFLGDSYYLSNSQLKSLRTKFKTKYWPTFLIFDKNGNFIEKQVGTNFQEHLKLQKMVEEN